LEIGDAPDSNPTAINHKQYDSRWVLLSRDRGGQTGIRTKNYKGRYNLRPQILAH
jgi:hypothetical protein